MSWRGALHHKLNLSGPNLFLIIGAFAQNSRFTEFHAMTPPAPWFGPARQPFLRVQHAHAVQGLRCAVINSMAGTPWTTAIALQIATALRIQIRPVTSLGLALSFRIS
jgi:hypothetical protein